MENEKWYECSLSMSYKASSPAEAAEMLLTNVATNPNWYVHVKELDTQKNFEVDTQTGETEEK
jgi:hypothetical protein